MTADEAANGFAMRELQAWKDGGMRNTETVPTLKAAFLAGALWQATATTAIGRCFMCESGTHDHEGPCQTYSTYDDGKGTKREWPCACPVRSIAWLSAWLNASGRATAS